MKRRERKLRGASERNRNKMGEINLLVHIKNNIIQILGPQMKMHY